MSTQTHAAQAPMQVNFGQLQDLLKQSRTLPRPLMIWGAPGVGKTACVDETFAKTTPMYAAYMDRTDINGWPVPDHKTKRTSYYMLGNLPMAGGKEGDETHCLFLDELSNAPRDVATAFLELVNRKTVNGQALASNVVLAGAGNRAMDQAGSNSMISSLQDRMFHVELVPDLDISSKHYLTTLTADSDTTATVVGYLRFRPEAFFQPPFVSPRSWQDTIDHISVTKQYEHAHGIVGSSIAAELLQFVKLKEMLPSIKSIMEAPATAALPDTIANPGVGYALVSMLTSYTLRHIDPATFDKAITYVTRLPVMYTAVLVSSTEAVLDTKQRAKVMGSSRAYAQWITENQEVLF